MKLIYIANVRIPTEKAHGVQIMKMCEAFALNGIEVELVLPNRKTSILKNPFDFYNVKSNFVIKKLFTIDLFSGTKFGFIIQTTTFYLSLFSYLLTKNPKNTILYTRGETALFLNLLRPKKRYVWETHIKPVSVNRYKKVFDSAIGIITVTKYYAEELVNNYNIPKNRLLVAADGVDIEDFKLEESAKESKIRIKLPFDKKIITYTGHLYEWKGVDTLAEAGNFLDDNYLIVFVGGTKGDILNFKNKYSHIKNIQIIGQKPYEEIKYFLNSSDILVLPNSAKSTTSQYYTSPLKLFEYMASGKPIISSNLVSLKEVLNEENAVFFEADNPKDLAAAITNLSNDITLSVKLGQNAKNEALKYTWNERARNIIKGIIEWQNE